MDKLLEKVQDLGKWLKQNDVSGQGQDDDWFKSGIGNIIREVNSVVDMLLTKWRW
jgi:hypothetical protein